MTIPGGAGDAERITWYGEFVNGISVPAQAAARSIDDLGDESTETAAELKLLQKQADQTGNSLALLAAKNKLAAEATDGHQVSVTKLREEYDKIVKAQDKNTKSWLKSLRTNKEVKRSWQQLLNFGKRLMSLFGGMTRVLGGLARALVYVSIAMGVLGLVGVVIKAVTWVTALAVELSSLLSLLFLIPTAISTLVLSLATLKMAFKGVGTAIGAGFGDDFKAYNEALNKLSPAAADFVRSVVSMAPELKSLQRTVQEEFFGPLVDDVVPTLKTLIPIIGAGATRLSGAFSKVFGTIMAWARSPSGVRAIEAMFRSAELFASTFNLHLLPLLESWTVLLEAIEPQWARLMNAMGVGMDKFAAWITEISTDGTLQRWMDMAFETSKLIAALLDPLARILIAFAGTTNGGALASLVIFLETVAAWMESAEGQRQLIEFFGAWDRVIKSLEPSLYILGDILVLLSVAIADMMEGGAADGFIAVLQAIADTLRSVTNENPNFWKEIGSGLGVVLHDLADMLPTILGWLLKFLNWLGNNPAVLEALIVIGIIIGMIMNFLPLIAAGGEVILIFITALIAGIAAIAAGAALAWATWHFLGDEIEKIWDGFTNFKENFTRWIQENLPKLLGFLVFALTKPWEAFKRAAQEAFDFIKRGWETMLGNLGVRDIDGGGIGWRDLLIWGATQVGAFRAAGGPVEGGQSYIVNELGQEKFFNKLTGSIEDIGDGRMGKWVAPASGVVLPAGLSDRLDGIVAAARVRGQDGGMDPEVASLLSRGGTGDTHYDQRQYHLKAEINQPKSDLDVEAAIRRAWKKIKREEAERR